MRRGSIHVAAVALAAFSCGGLLASPPAEDGGFADDAASKDATSEPSGTDGTPNDATDAADGGWALSFKSMTVPTNLLFIEDVEIADVTGDGRADVIITGSWWDADASDNMGGVFVYAQQGDGTLAAPVFTDPGSFYPASLTPADLTNDGRTDLALVTPGGFGVLAQDETGHLLPLVSYAINDAALAVDRIAVGRFGPNTKLDAIQSILTNTDQAMWLWLQTSNGFDGAGPFSVPAFDLVASGDLDGDGHDDVVVSYIDEPYVSVVPQLAPATFGPRQDYTFTTDTAWDQVEGLAVGDVTGDGLADVIASYGGNNPDCHLAVLPQRNGKLDPVVTYDTLDLPTTVRIADMNGDGRLDVVVDHAGFEQLGIYVQAANGTLEAEQLFPFKNASVGRGHGIAVGDINGDGRPDVVGVSSETESLLFLLSQ